MPGLRTATLLFTDLVDSTPLFEQLGDAGTERLRRAHARLLRTEIEARDGQLVKSTGDGVMAAFAAPTDAVACAVAVQQLVGVHNRTPGGTPLHVRVGIHVGEVTEDDGDFHGAPVVVASRLCAIAEGGQILASDTVRSMASTREGVRFKPVGELALKGFTEPVAAAQVLFDHVDPENLRWTPNRENFVGREPELKQLDAMWRVACGGNRALVLLSGEPGIGKTRLALRQGEAALESGGLVLIGRCDEQAPIPFLPFTDALGRHLPTPSSQPETPMTTVIGAEDAERHRFFTMVSTTLQELAATRPVLLVIDDLHWADEGTLTLLRHVVRRPEPARLMIVGTYRDTDLSRNHPLSAMLGELVRDGATQIDVRGLDRASVDAMLGASVAPSTALAVYDETEGNPFFVQEVARHLTETGVMGTVPKGVRDVIGRRLSRLPDASVDILRIGAVLGREFDLDVLVAVAEVSDDNAIRAIDHARAARLVDEVPGVLDQWRFSHALVRETLLHEVGTSRRVRIHERIVTEIERLYADDLTPHLIALAHHANEAAAAGNTTRAARYALKAAEFAMQRFGFEEGARLCRIGLDALDLGKDDTRLRCELLLRLSEGTGWIDPSAADEAGRQALELAAVLDDAELQARAAISVFALVPGQYDPVQHERLSAALALLDESDIQMRALLHGMLAATTSAGRDRSAALDHSRQALALASACSPPTAVQAVYLATFPTSLSGESRYSDQLVDIAMQANAPYLEGPGRTMRMVGQFARCELNAARVELERLGELATETPSGLVRYSYLTAAATFATVEGRFRDASRHAREAGQIARVSFGTVFGDLSTLTPGMAAFPRLRAQGRSHELLPMTEAAVGSRQPGPGWNGALAALFADVGRLDDARLALELLAADGFAALIQPVAPWHLDRYTTALAIEAAAAAAETEMIHGLYDLLAPEADLAPVLAYGPVPIQWLGSCHLYLGIAAREFGEHDVGQRHLRTALEVHQREGAVPLTARTQHELALCVGGREADELWRLAAKTASELELRPLAAAIAAARSSGD